VDPAELYIGVLTRSGLLWADPGRGFVSAPTRAYVGSLPGFGPLTIIDLPDVSTLPPGPYWWFVIVDRDSDGVPAGDIADMVLTIVSQE
jgi:hypothetical protein